MGNKMLKIGGTVAAGGALLQIGCGGDWWTQALQMSAVAVGVEFLTDNDAVFDLFQDDFGTGTQYDDRFTADPTRDEPDDDAQAAANAVAGR